MSGTLVPGRIRRRVRRAFGAAHAFPIRERYLLGPTDPPRVGPERLRCPATRLGLLTRPEPRANPISEPSSEAFRLPAGPCGRSGPERKVAGSRDEVNAAGASATQRFRSINAGERGDPPREKTAAGGKVVRQNSPHGFQDGHSGGRPQQPKRAARP